MHAPPTADNYAFVAAVEVLRRCASTQATLGLSDGEVRTAVVVANRFQDALAHHVSKHHCSFVTRVGAVQHRCVGGWVACMTGCQCARALPLGDPRRTLLFHLLSAVYPLLLVGTFAFAARVTASRGRSG